jgi:hypothetical protein
MVRPRSASPLGDLNSSEANFCVRWRCCELGTDWVARERRARARVGEGGERVVMRKVA